MASGRHRASGTRDAHRPASGTRAAHHRASGKASAHHHASGTRAAHRPASGKASGRHRASGTRAAHHRASGKASGPLRGGLRSRNALDAAGLHHALILHRSSDAVGSSRQRHRTNARLACVRRYRPARPCAPPRLTLRSAFRALTRNGHPTMGGHFTKEVRRCPTLPQGLPCSTIGAERLSFRVRNGTGRFPLAMAAETLLMFQSAQQKSLSCGSRPYIENHSVDANTSSTGVLSSHRLISTSQLHVLPRFHIWPINPVV